MELNTDRPGFDYRNFDLTAADANPCRAQCEAETQCLSWTYVAPGVQGVNARCWLKKAVPQQMANGCCISGVKRLGPPRVASIGNARGVASSYWSHNGSSLYLMAEGDRRRFYYETPRPGMAGQGVERGTLLFDGQKVGNNYQGTAYVFDRQCGKFPYAVSGAGVRLQVSRQTLDGGGRRSNTALPPRSGVEGVGDFTGIDGDAVFVGIGVIVGPRGQVDEKASLVPTFCTAWAT
jgi:hypothetical protein